MSFASTQLRLMPQKTERSTRNGEQHALQFIVKLAAYLCHLFVTELAKQRGRPVIFEKGAAAAVLVEQDPQRRISAAGSL